MIGAASVILQKPHPVSATTITTCCLLRIPGPVFIGLAETDARVSRFVQQESSHELYDIITQLVGMACSSARLRLERLLWQLVSRQASHSTSEIRIRPPLRYWELAQLISVTPQHLSKIMKQMEDEGLIRRERGCLIINAPDRLSDACHS
jgi:CRP/FNR family transcriptional regulator, cyclic AMP receptor protein